MVHGQGREVWLLKVHGMNDPEAVSVLAGHTLFMHACERPALAGTDEYYVQELIGMQVGNILPRVWHPASVLRVSACHPCTCWGVQVILQETGQSIGVVVDLHDGTGGRLLWGRLSGTLCCIALTTCQCEPAGTHDVLRVRLSDEADERAGDQASCPRHSRTALVPFVADIVPVVDRAERRLELRPPVGLLELASRQAPIPAKRRR